MSPKKIFHQKDFSPKKIFTQKISLQKFFTQTKFFTQIARLSFVDLRWAQLYVSLVLFFITIYKKTSGQAYIEQCALQFT